MLAKWRAPHHQPSVIYTPNNKTLYIAHYRQHCHLSCKITVLPFLYYQYNCSDAAILVITDEAESGLREMESIPHCTKKSVNAG